MSEEKSKEIQKPEKVKKIWLVVIPISIIFIIILVGILLVPPIEYETKSRSWTHDMDGYRKYSLYTEYEDNTELHLEYQVLTSGHHITIYFMDEKNFGKFEENVNYEALITQVFRTKGEFDVTLEEGGRYWIVFIDLDWSFWETRTVKIKIDRIIKYPKI